MHPAVLVDDATDKIYVVYHYGTAANSLNVYYRISEDGGQTWSEESDTLNSVAGEYTYIRSNFMNSDTLYAVYYDTGNDDLYGSLIPFSWTCSVDINRIGPGYSSICCFSVFYVIICVDKEGISVS